MKWPSKRYSFGWVPTVSSWCSTDTPLFKDLLFPGQNIMGVGSYRSFSVNLTSTVSVGPLIEPGPLCSDVGLSPPPHGLRARALPASPGSWKLLLAMSRVRAQQRPPAQSPRERGPACRFWDLSKPGTYSGTSRRGLRLSARQSHKTRPKGGIIPTPMAWCPTT